MEHEAVFLGMRAAEVWGVSAALITTVIFYIIARISGDPKDGTGYLRCRMAE